MRIKRITVKKFKNLVDFDCEFSDSNISAFIGNNGAGKVQYSGIDNKSI